MVVPKLLPIVGNIKAYLDYTNEKNPTARI